MHQPYRLILTESAIHENNSILFIFSQCALFALTPSYRYTSSFLQLNTIWVTISKHFLRLTWDGGLFLLIHVWWSGRMSFHVKFAAATDVWEWMNKNICISSHLRGSFFSKNTTSFLSLSAKRRNDLLMSFCRPDYRTFYIGMSSPLCSCFKDRLTKNSSVFSIFFITQSGHF